MSTDVGQEGIVTGDYNIGMVCYYPTNPVSIYGMLMVGSGCGIGMENIITLTALSRMINGVDGVSLSVGQDQLLSQNTSPCLPW